MLKTLDEEIEEARSRVAHSRIKAERPNATLYDAFALERARNKLQSLELKKIKRDS